MNKKIKITKEDLVIWLNRPPTDYDLELCAYLEKALENQEKYYNQIQKLQEENNRLQEEINNKKCHYKNIVNNQLAECLEPDCEDFYLAEIESKANTLDKFKKWISSRHEPKFFHQYELMKKIDEIEKGVK